MALATDEHACTLSHCFLHDGLERQCCSLINHRADLGGFIHGVATNVFPGLFDQSTGEFFGDGFLDQDAFDGGAALA